MDLTLRAREASRLSRRSGSNDPTGQNYFLFRFRWKFNFLESDIAFFITIYHFIKNVYNIKI